MEDKKTIIGYSGFLLFEGCYEYNEDACYLADSKDSVMEFMKHAGHTRSDFRVDEVSIKNLIDDYGYSSGEYTMEKSAFEKFKAAAATMGLRYKYEDYYMDPDLKVVNL